MTEPETIRRRAPAVDTSAEKLTALRDALSDFLRLPMVRSLTRADEVFDALLAALAARQREVVGEALQDWGSHAPGCDSGTFDGQGRKTCACGFDQALDRLAPKEGW